MQEKQKIIESQFFEIPNKTKVSSPNKTKKLVLALISALVIIPIVGTFIYLKSPSEPSKKNEKGQTLKLRNDPNRFSSSPTRLSPKRKEVKRSTQQNGRKPSPPSSEPQLHVPLPKSELHKHIVGLENYGQTCFANSAVQFLYHSADFRGALENYLELAVKKHFNAEEVKSATTLNNLFTAMDQKKSFTSILKPQIYAALPVELRQNQQFDSSEILRYYGNFAHFDWTKFLLVEISTQNIVYSVNGVVSPIASVSDAALENSILVLSIPDGSNEDSHQHSMQDLLKERYTESERELSEAEADSGQIIKASHWLNPVIFPENLIVQVKRFYQDSKGVDHKYTKSIYCDEIIDFNPFMRPEEAQKMMNAPPPQYRLVGFIKHIGSSAKSGHYVSYFKPENDAFEIDDSRCSPIDHEQFIQEANASYIFMYKKQKMPLQLQ
jgi:ubiquitin C-terminal hydrolase